VWATSPRNGIPELRQALGGHLSLSASCLAITGGVRGEIARLLSGAGSLVIETPTFLSIPRLAAQAGLPVKSLSWERILDGDSVGSGSVVWLTSPARNPDGRTLTEAEAARLDEIADTCRKVVINQAYHWAAPDEARPAKAVLLGSLHKLAGGGCMLGWRYDPWESVPDRPAAGGAPRLWQQAWAAFIDAGGLSALAQNGLLRPQSRCRQFAIGLDLPVPVRLSYGCGPSLLLHLPEHLTEEHVLKRFSEQGLSVGPGSSFGCQSVSVRLSFTGVADRLIPECIEKVRSVLTALCQQ
jgi:DNA-binding transcriptional MocR family regulator